LGTNVTGVVVASIFNSTSVLEIGSNTGGTASLAIGAFYEVKLYNSALGSGAGTPVFDANFALKPFGANSFTESSSNAATVTINGTIAQVGDGRIGIVSSAPGTQATLSKASGIVSCNYLSLQDSRAIGAGWYAGANSVNVSDNSGWVFANAPSGKLGLLGVG
jgi:hypothetical protein